MTPETSITIYTWPVILHMARDPNSAEKVGLKLWFCLLFSPAFRMTSKKTGLGEKLPGQMDDEVL